MKQVSCSAVFFFFTLLFFFFVGALPGLSGQRGAFCNSYRASGVRGGASARNVMVQSVVQAVPAVAATVGIANMVRAGYRWITGKKQKQKNSSFAGHECHCEDPDLCWVKRQNDDEIKQLHDQFLQTQGYNLYHGDLSRAQVAWSQLGFDKLSEDAQQFLQKRFCAIEDEQRSHSFQQIAMQPVQHQEPEKKVERISPEKPEAFSDQELVQSRFIQRADEIKQYGQTLVSGNDRQQKRRDAIHEALENGFRVSYKRYRISDGASALLGEYGIDTIAFQECTGNAIQQQTHAEFVDILNGVAELLLSDQMQELSDSWVCALGNFSHIGTQSSAAGNYSLAYQLSDICHKIYHVAEAMDGFFREAYEFGTGRFNDLASGCKEFIKKSYCYPQKTFKDVNSVLNDGAVRLTEFGKWSEGFLRGVGYKAFVRPFEQFAEFSAYTRSNPEVIREMVNKLVYATAQSVYKGYLFSLALETDPTSERTQRCAQEFHEVCLAPLCAGISVMEREFAKLSKQEKAEELVALAVQWATFNGLGNVVNAVAHEGQLTKLANFIRATEEAPGFKAALGSGGVVSVSFPVGQEVSTSIVTGLGVSAKVGATGVLATSKVFVPSNNEIGPDVATGEVQKRLIEKSIALKAAQGRCCDTCKNLLVQEGGCADQCCSACKQAAEALQNSYDKGSTTYRNLIDKGPVKGTKILLSKESFCLTEAQLKQLEPFFNRMVKSKGVFAGKEIPEEFVLSEKFWRHVFTGELEMLMDSSGAIKPRLSGFHFDELAKNLKSKALKLSNIVRDGKTGAYRGQIRPQGSVRPLQKSFFPAEWSPKRAADKIVEALGNIEWVRVQNSGRFKLFGRTKCGIEIEIISESCGKLVTAYPLV